MAARGAALRGALTAAPSRVGARPQRMPQAQPGIAAGASRAFQGNTLQRVSPGMYRNQQGQLINSRNGMLPAQRPQPSRPPMQVPQPQQPSNDMVWAGGTPNYNEVTGQYNNPAMQPQLNAKFQTHYQAMLAQQQQPQFAQGFSQGLGFQQQGMQQAMQPQFGQGQPDPYKPYMPGIVDTPMQPGIAANQQPLASNGQLSPTELQAMRNGAFKGYSY